MKLHRLLFSNLILLSNLKDKSILTPHFFDRNYRHVSMCVPSRPEMNTNRFVGVGLARLGYTANMFTKPSFYCSLSAPNVLGPLASCTLSTALHAADTVHYS